MKRIIFPALALALATISPARAAASPVDAPATIFHGTQFDLPSKIVGRPFRIYVYSPLKPPPPAGYPLIVLLDGNAYFPIAATAAMLAEAGGGKGALVVGVGYPTEDFAAGTVWRNRDLSPPTALETVTTPPGQPTPTATTYGGDEDFYRFLTEELQPALAARLALDPADRTLYGHSFGGLFALRTLFRHSAAFQTYLISSPAISWSNSVVLKDEAAFVRQVEAGTVAPRIMIAAGGDEQTPPEHLPPGYSPEMVAKLLAEYRTIDYSRELAARLAAVKGQPRYEVRFRLLPGESHGSVPFPGIMHGFEFALKP